MEKSKFLTLLVIALLLLNLGLLAYLFLGNSKPQHKEKEMRPNPREIVIRKLNFSDKQIESYKVLIKDHRAKISFAEKRNMELKNHLYQFLLKTSENKSTTDSIINLLAENQKLIETTHFNHFADIKKLCEPSQLKAFEELATELSQIFGPPRMRRKND